MNAVTNGISDKFVALLTGLLTVVLTYAALQHKRAEPVAREEATDPSLAAAFSNSRPIVSIKTTKGTFTIELFSDKAPKTSANFLSLVKKGFYDGLTFHRYEQNFVVQGGDPSGNGCGGYIDPTTNELKTIDLEVSPELSHYKRGMLAMAHMSDPDSASSQFYITLSPQTFLDGKYAVFAQVVDGLPVVMQLRRSDRIVTAKLLHEPAK